MVRPFILTRSTKWPSDKTEEKKRARVQQNLIKIGFRRIEDWEPKGQVTARVYEGAWIADCPTPNCGGAEYVDPEWPLFVCTSGCGCGPVKVTFPKEREAIEALLLRRPALATQNWFPSEKVKDLAAENERHGV